MAPKPPKFIPPKSDTHEPQTPRPWDGQTMFAPPPRADIDPPTLPIGRQFSNDEQTALLPPPIAGPAIHLSDDAASPPSVLPTGEPLSPYRVSTYSRNRLPAPNAQGLRVHVGRHFVDLEDGTTVQVDWDASTSTYRAKRPNESGASGPSLYLNDDRKTWSTNLDRSAGSPPAAKRPLLDRTDLLPPDATSSTFNTDHYVWNEAASNHHGYVVMHRKKGLDSAVGPQRRYAFREENGSFVGVEPSAVQIDQPAQLLPAWTDRDLWDFYGIHGDGISRFRAEANRTGKKPQWAKPRVQRMENAFLYDELRRWTAPDMDRDVFINLMQKFNFTPDELARKLDNVSLRWKETLSPSTSNPAPTGETPSTSRADVDAPVFGDPAHYDWDISETTLQGYVELHRKPGLSDGHGPAVQLAFLEGHRLIRVRSTGYSSHQPTALRPLWRDFDIWNLYRIEGADIVRFRQEVASSGKQPKWVTPREYPSRREQLVDYLRFWSSPQATLKPPAEFIAGLRPYNFSIEHLSQLCDELTETGQYAHRINNDLPRWAEAHRRSMLDEANSRRFEPFLPEIHAEILRLRNQGKGSSFLRANLTPAFFQGLLLRCGYQRNKHNCLYRTDIPALFRGDDRTPFEFARDGAMLPRAILAEGTTTLTAVSATFRLKTAVDYAKEAKGEALAYATQLSRFPGKPVDPDKAPLTDRELHLTTDYASRRLSQRIAFCYVLDTRNVEVVPGPDNRVYNQDAIRQRPAYGKTWFPQGTLEGHVSMSLRGFSAARIWLVNSSLTRAARVGDIHAQALEHASGINQNHADAIETRTWAGELNRHEYDDLIDEVASAGKPVIELPAATDIFSDGIVFPPELITL